MRFATAIQPDPSFITLCIKTAQSTFSDVMPSHDDPRSAAKASKSPTASPIRGRSWASAISDWFYYQQVADPDEIGIGYGADTDPAGDLALEGTGMAAQRLGGRDDLLRLREQGPPGGGEFHPARQPFEQRDAEFILERLDLRA